MTNQHSVNRTILAPDKCTHSKTGGLPHVFNASHVKQVTVPPEGEAKESSMPFSGRGPVQSVTADEAPTENGILLFFLTLLQSTT